MVAEQFNIPPWDPHKSSCIRTAQAQINYGFQQLTTGVRTEFQLQQMESWLVWLRTQL